MVLLRKNGHEALSECCLPGVLALKCVLVLATPHKSRRDDVVVRGGIHQLVRDERHLAELHCDFCQFGCFACVGQVELPLGGREKWLHWCVASRAAGCLLLLLLLCVLLLRHASEIAHN